MNMHWLVCEVVAAHVRFCYPSTPLPTPATSTHLLHSLQHALKSTQWQLDERPLLASQRVRQRLRGTTIHCTLVTLQHCRSKRGATRAHNPSSMHVQAGRAPPARAYESQQRAYSTRLHATHLGCSKVQVEQ